MERIIIAALAENRVIGKDGDIPWYEPEDFQHFKETTQGHPVIMGYVTFAGIAESLGGPLPDRLNIVLSHEDEDVDLPDSDDVVNVHSIEAALAAAEQTGDDEVYIAGGASIYEQFLAQGLADEMVLTHIPGEYDGDAYFPDWDDDRWQVTDEWHGEDNPDLVFRVYEQTGN